VDARVSKMRLKRLLHASHGKLRGCRSGLGSADKPSVERKVDPIGPKVALYRHFNARGKLLYVGISVKPLDRLLSHVSGSAWVSEIVRIEISWCADRTEAMLAEADAIKSERPLWNQVHSPAHVVNDVRLAKKQAAAAHLAEPKKRGPTKSGNALSAAEKQRAYRERKRGA